MPWFELLQQTVGLGEREPMVNGCITYPVVEARSEWETLGKE